MSEYYRQKNRALYMDPEVMDAHLASQKSIRDTLTEARYCLRIAKSPENRFGLTPEDTVNVIPVCEMYLAGAEVAASFIAEKIKALKEEERAWDTTWRRLGGLGGFKPGDAHILGLQDL